MVPSFGLTVPCFHVSVAACTLPPRNAWVEETGDPGSHNPVLYPDANSLNQCQTVHVGGGAPQLPAVHDCCGVAMVPTARAHLAPTHVVPVPASGMGIAASVQVPNVCIVSS